MADPEATPEPQKTYHAGEDPPPERLPLLIRQAQQDDVPFIMSSWLKSFRDKDQGFAEGCPNRIFYACHHRVVEVLLPRSMVVVACDENDPRTIVAWACYERGDGGCLVVHYLYVKQPLRRNGVARQLMTTLLAIEGEPETVFYTHRTEAVERMRSLPRSRFVFHPYLMFHALPQDWIDPDALRPKAFAPSTAEDAPPERPGVGQGNSRQNARNLADGSRWRGGIEIRR